MKKQSNPILENTEKPLPPPAPPKIAVENKPCSHECKIKELLHEANVSMEVFELIELELLEMKKEKWGLYEKGFDDGYAQRAFEEKIEMKILEKDKQTHLTWKVKRGKEERAMYEYADSVGAKTALGDLVNTMNKDELNRCLERIFSTHEFEGSYFKS